MDPNRVAHTLVLPIDPDIWPPPARGIRVDGISFAPKAELHVTLIGSRLGRELHATLGPAFLHEQLDRTFAALDWRFTRTGQHLLLARPPSTGRTADADALPRRAIIELVELPAMRPFHHALGRLLGRQLPVPPAHVTLYTAGDRRGIGLPTPARLRALGRTLQQPL